MMFRNYHLKEVFWNSASTVISKRYFGVCASTAISKKYFGILLFSYWNTPHCVLSLQRNSRIRNENRKNYTYHYNAFKDS